MAPREADGSFDAEREEIEVCLRCPLPSCCDTSPQCGLRKLRQRKGKKREGRSDLRSTNPKKRKGKTK